jgi:hypothetical protein
MNFAPSIAVALVIGVMIGLLVGWAVLRRTRLETPDSSQDRTQRFMQQHAVRLALAQHWARGGLLSEPTEPWRPIVSAAALAALAASDDRELDRLLSAQCGQIAASETEAANVWRQVLAELAASRASLDPELATGKNAAGESTWPDARLRDQAAELLRQAHVAGAAAIEKRRAPRAVS